MSKHKIISFIKSGIRIVGCLFGMIFFWGNFFPMHAFAFLLLAEGLGIVEEFYEGQNPNNFFLPEYTDWSGTQYWKDDWKNGPDGSSFGVKEQD